VPDTQVWTLIQRLNWIRDVRNHDLDSASKIVFVMLLSHDGPNGCFPSISTLADEAVLSRSTVKRALRSLEALGAITKVSRTSTESHAPTSNYYQFKNVDQKVGPHRPYVLPEIGVIQTPGRATQTLPSGHTDPTLGSHRPPNRLIEQTTGTLGALPQTPPATPGPNGLTPPESRGSQTTLAGIIPPSQPAPPPKPQKPPRKPAKQSKGEPEKEPSGFPEVVDAYFEAFERARGTRPVFDAREGKAVRELIAKAGKDVAIARIRDAYANEYWRSKVTIQEISSNPDKYCGAKPVPRESNLPDVDDMIAAARRKNANTAK